MSRIGSFSKVLTSALLCLLLASTTVAAKEPEEDRAKIREQSAEVLQRLYAAQPSARSVIAGSAGYATFSRIGLTLGVVGGGVGKGLAVAVPSKKETFMRFVEGSAGLGLGIKKYDVIFVFQNAAAMNDFVTKGWEAGGQATAAAKVDDKGKAVEGAVSVSPGVWVYQITGKGLAAELGIKGTKYYADKDLN
ncbi:YSC84-related protein [Arenimonas daejeonensis]|uniref:lipid-binding SYLF domain-containing protein n=1 Tax=Arenimonas daejeonensis TaxID=370777 RepID=UPI0011BDB77A|nr:YSC84-related protein [Arenimonas daejeonensis]